LASEIIGKLAQANDLKGVIASRTSTMPTSSVKASMRRRAPRAIPRRIVVVKEEPPPDLGVGVIGGVPGGAVNGVVGGVLGGTNISSLPPPRLKTPPPRPTIIRVGGRVKPPQLISHAQPQYPVIAKLANVQGTVLIDAVIDQQGNVVQERAVSGPGLLIPAALQAVSQWKYEPTYLNGEPVSLATQITVEFRLYG
jgi:periplasmic protein TonB